MKFLKTKKYLLSTCFLATMILGSATLGNNANLINIESLINTAYAASTDKYGVTIGGTSVPSNTRIRLNKKTIARKGTSTSTASVRTLSKNSTVKVTHTTASWARVIFNNGRTGWIPLSSGKMYLKTSMFKKIYRAVWPSKRISGGYTIDTGIKFLNEGKYQEAILTFDKEIKIEQAPKGYKKPTSKRRSQIGKIDFADLEGHWAKDPLQYYLGQNIIQADNLDKANPDRALTRAEFISILVRCFELKGSANNITFKDVNSNHTYYEDLCVAFSNNLINSSENFEPDKLIDRNYAIELLINLLSSKIDGLKAIDKEVLTDSIIDLIATNDSDTFETEEEFNLAPITKAQIAHILYTMVHQTSNQETLDGFVLGNSVRLRLGPSTSTEILASLNRGTVVKILDNSNLGWYLVDYNGKIGYISKDYIGTKDSTTMITTTSLILREGPGTDYSKVLTMPKNSNVIVLDNSDSSWFKIKYKTYIGYASSNYLSLNERRVSEDSTLYKTPNGEKICDISKSSIVNINEIQNEWVNVTTKDHKTGYIKRSHLAYLT